MEHRIVTLIASATEIVAALGFERQLVGRSHECDYPASVLSLPACSEPKIDVHGSSREIDDRVKAVVKDGLSVYRVHADVLGRLKPTVIVTQTQCEVCAVSLKDVEAAVCELVDSRPAIVSLEPMSLSDVWEDIRRVGTAIGAIPQASRLSEELRERLERIEKRAKSLKPRPTIACIEWIDPLMAAGNWVPELVEIAGGVSLFGTAGAHSPWMTFEQLLARDPDVIAIMPCGFDIQRTRTEIPALTNRPGWESLSAVRNGRVFLTDGNQYFNRPGPRLVESAEILAEILHPGTFDFGHERTGWVRL
jgi:iron complex transport system substrate-binding protein